MSCCILKLNPLSLESYCGFPHYGGRVNCSSQFFILLFRDHFVSPETDSLFLPVTVSLYFLNKWKREKSMKIGAAHASVDLGPVCK